MAELDQETIEREAAALRISKRKVAAVETGDGDRFLVFEAGKRPAAIRLEVILDAVGPGAGEIVNRWFEGRKDGSGNGAR